MKNFLRALRFVWPYRHRLFLSIGCALLAAVLGVDQQQRAERDDQKNKTRDRQIGDLASAPRRTIDGVENRRCQQPGER